MNWLPLLTCLIWASLLDQAPPQTARPIPPNDNAGVTVHTNVAYGPGLLLDVYLPPAKYHRPRAGVLEIHGGGWQGGDKDNPADTAVSQALARNGYVVFCIDYRLVKRPTNGYPAKNSYPAALDDCQRAVRWVRCHAEEYGVDPKRIGAAGGSAGGHLAAMLGTRDTRDNSDPALAAYSSRVQAVVDFFGPADLTQPFPTKPFNVQAIVDSFVGTTNIERQREASPIFGIDAQTPPFLILQGAADLLVPPEQSRELNAALKKAGRDSTYIEFPGEWHGFQKPENKALANQKILEFLRRTLGDK